jgi:signal transduction histidine kinase
VQGHPTALPLCKALNLLGLGCVAVQGDEWGLDAVASLILGEASECRLISFQAVRAKVHLEDVERFHSAFANLADNLNLHFRIAQTSDHAWTLIHAVSDGAVVVLKDVTAQRLSEDERMRMIDMFTETSQMESLGTLAGGIAHEINNPTQFIGDNLKFISDAIGGLFDIAEEVQRAAKSGCGWDKVSELVNKIPVSLLAKEIPAAAKQALDGVDRIGSIVQAIREFCYPGVKTPVPLSLNHLIEIAVTVTRNKWKYAAQMQLDLAETLPMIVAVEGEIYQILVNLIVNAVQSISEKKGEEEGVIHIITSKEGKMVRLRVTDSGMGIPPEIQSRIFDMFFTTKTSGQGTGQGLAITQAIVYRHGGKISVHSNMGQGATFDILLPALDEQ